MEHILVFDDDITMDVIIYDSTLHGRPSQVSGIWRWKISFLQTMMTECLIVNNGRISTLLFLNFWAKQYYILWLACCNNGNICCVLSSLKLMQFYSVMAFAHRYDKNKHDYGDNNYCYDDIPKVAIVFIGLHPFNSCY